MSESTISLIEKAISMDVGRGIDALSLASRGGLFNAASSIANHDSPHVGIISGFYIPHGNPPAAENDGPVGMAQLIEGFNRAGIPVRIATDSPCAGVANAAINVAGANTPLDLVALDDGEGETIEVITQRWKDVNVSHVIAIERCGKSIDGKPRNARGDDISAHTAPLDDLFTGGDWDTIAIGDGGNEIGMGAIDAKLIAANIKNGARIACVTPARHLIVAGVSNWAAWGLLGALALLLPQKKGALTASLNSERELEILRHINHHGPSIDGISGQTRDAVDGLEWEFHAKILKQVTDIIF